MRNNKYFEFISMIKTVIDHRIFSDVAIKVELSKGEYESAIDFANKIGFLLLEAGKEIYKAEKHESLTFYVEFYNDDVYMAITHNYGVWNDLEKYEKVYEILEEDSEYENFILRVKYKIKWI